jgi:hypothetical protein
MVSHHALGSPPFSDRSPRGQAALRDLGARAFRTSWDTLPHRFGYRHIPFHVCPAHALLVGRTLHRANRCLISGDPFPCRLAGSGVATRIGRTTIRLTPSATRRGSAAS